MFLSVALKADGSHTQWAWPPLSSNPFTLRVPPSVCLLYAKLLTVLKIRSTLLTLALPTPDLSSYPLSSITSVPRAFLMLHKHAKLVLPQGLCTGCSSCPELSSSRSCHGGSSSGLSSKVTFSDSPSLTPSCCSPSSSCLIFLHQRLHWDVLSPWCGVCLSGFEALDGRDYNWPSARSDVTRPRPGTAWHPPISVGYMNK